MEKRENPKLRNSGKVVICFFKTTTTTTLLPIITTVIISIPKHLYNSQEKIIKKREPDSSDCCGERVTIIGINLNVRGSS